MRLAIFQRQPAEVKRSVEADNHGSGTQRFPEFAVHKFTSRLHANSLRATILYVSLLSACKRTDKVDRRFVQFVRVDDALLLTDVLVAFEFAETPPEEIQILANVYGRFTIEHQCEGGPFVMQFVFAAARWSLVLYSRVDAHKDGSGFGLDFTRKAFCVAVVEHPFSM